MILRRALLITLLGLAACSPLSSLAGFGDRVDGDREQVAVTGFASAVEATPFAVAHCARFGRSAQYVTRKGERLNFACVAK